MQNIEFVAAKLLEKLDTFIKDTCISGYTILV